jgi:DtxR family Mn-dependent transcriptional regulator
VTVPTLSSAAQDYLKVIWSAGEWSDTRITTTSLAAKLGFSPSTVSEAVKKLTQQGLLTHERYGSIALTPAGHEIALAMVRRHRIIETFLVDYLGYNWDEVHDEAEVLEHAVSDRLIDGLADRLGNPVRDPHGDPIPSSTGPSAALTSPVLNAVQLSAVGEGEAVTVARVSDAEPALLRYLSEIGIGLDTELTLVERSDFAGTIVVRLGAAVSELTLGIPVAAAIWVVH